MDTHLCPKVHLFVSCRKLKDTDVLSKTDAFVVLYELDAQNRWVKVGSTEVVENNLNPDFVHHFELKYLFEMNQSLKFEVYDSDDGRPVIHKDHFIGETICTLAEIQGSQGQQMIRSIKDKQKTTGNLVARTEQINENNDTIFIQFAGENLEDNGGFFHSFQPFFCLSRIMENGAAQKVYQSERLKGRNVIWKIIQQSIKDLANGDMGRPLRFDLMDHHRSGNHDFLASCEFTLSKISEESQKKFVLLNPKKKGKKNYKDSGFAVVKSFQMIKNHSLMDFVRGGCKIELSIAIDYTASNGLPNNPNSLHFINPNGMNQYEQALYAVSQILLCYDSNKRVPVYGFGGKIQGNTSHCFHVNFNPHDPRISELTGIMQAYRNSLRYVELNGPTLFAQFLGRVIGEIESRRFDQLNQFYSVLLILTDGEIHDMQDTINLIVRGSNLPLSIVIVGLGNDSFTNMRQLDADDTPLIDSRGVKMSRDIVQFVPFREVSNSPQKLAEEVLAEIPRELTGFFKLRGIVPNPPVAAAEFDYERSYTIDMGSTGVNPYLVPEVSCIKPAGNNSGYASVPPGGQIGGNPPVYGTVPPGSQYGNPGLYGTVPPGNQHGNPGLYGTVPPGNQYGGPGVYGTVSHGGPGYGQVNYSSAQPVPNNANIPPNTYQNKPQGDYNYIPPSP